VRKIYLIVAMAILILISVLLVVTFKNQQIDTGNINNFESCQNAGYAVGESYPRVCFGPDGKTFTEATPQPTSTTPSGDENIACTMDAKLCPDGSYVGRIPPDCEFAPCPGEQ